MAKRKRPNNDLQSIAHKAKDRVTQALLNIGVTSGRINSSCFTSGTRRVNLVANPVTSHEWGNRIGMSNCQF